MNDDLLPQEPVPSFWHELFRFWRTAVGAVLGLAIAIIWAWKGLAWALLALILMVAGATLARLCSSSD